MNPIREVRVSCFEISQIPSQQTDYRHTIRGSGTHRGDLEPWIYGIHKVLAEPLVRNDCIIVGQVAFPPDNEAINCILNCRQVEVDGRPILHTQAISIPVRELLDAKLEPVDLLYSDIWKQMNGQPSASMTARCTEPPYHRRASQDALSAAAEALVRRNGEVERFEDWDHESAIALIKCGLDQLGAADRMKASFSIGVPTNRSLPTRPTLMIGTKAPTKHSGEVASGHAGDTEQSAYPAGERGTRNRVRPIDEEYDRVANDCKKHLSHIAVEFAKAQIPSAWQVRLWNKCQDVISYIDASQKSEQGHAYHSRILQANEDLAREIERAGVDPDARIRSKLLSQTHFLARNAPSRFLRGARTNVVLILGVVVLTCVIAYLFWPRRAAKNLTQSQSPAPAVKMSKAEPSDY